MDNKEILENLRNLKDLLDQFTQQHDYYENGCALAAIEKIDDVKASVSAMPGIPSVVGAMPVFPVGEKEYQKPLHLSIPFCHSPKKTKKDMTNFNKMIDFT